MPRTTTHLHLKELLCHRSLFLAAGSARRRRWSRALEAPSTKSFVTHTMSYHRIMQIAPVKPTISGDLLEKLDIRVGTIQLVEDVKGSKKLVRLTVSFGNHKRKILAGLKTERQDPKEVEGKQALFVVNLEAKEMMGEYSEGMVLDIGYKDGIKPVLAVPEDTVPDGTRAG